MYYKTILLSLLALSGAYFSNAQMTFFEKMPEFPGDVNEYLAANIKYPKEARKKHIEGLVLVTFVVDSTGHLDNVRVAKSAHPLLDSEAIRVVRNMPRWEPAIKNGKRARINFTVPVSFSR